MERDQPYIAHRQKGLFSPSHFYVSVLRSSHNYTSLFLSLVYLTLFRLLMCVMWLPAENLFHSGCFQFKVKTFDKNHKDDLTFFSRDLRMNNLVSELCYRFPYQRYACINGFHWFHNLTVLILCSVVRVV